MSSGGQGASKPRSIAEGALRVLIDEALYLRFQVVGQSTAAGYVVQVRARDEPRVLVNARGELRVFVTLDAAASAIRRFGKNTFEVDLTDYRKGRVRKARPDRSRILKAAHRAARSSKR